MTSQANATATANMNTQVSRLISSYLDNLDQVSTQEISLVLMQAQAALTRSNTALVPDQHKAAPRKIAQSAPGPSPERERPIGDRARDALARITGHEATTRNLAREIVRDEIGAEPPSHLVTRRRDDLRKYASLFGRYSDPALVALVIERDWHNRATHFRLPPKTAA